MTCSWIARYGSAVFLCVSVAGLVVGACTCHGAEFPQPTFSVSFDGTCEPQVMTGRKDHPAAAAKSVRYVAGRGGKAVLLGKGPILVYYAHGNGPDQATRSFWIKPDWKMTPAWRYLSTIRSRGRHTMMFAAYPQHVRLWVRGHSMALVEVTGHHRYR